VIIVVYWSEEVMLQCEDDGLLKNLIIHYELLCGSGDISVSVLESYTSESSLFHLDGDISRQVELGFIFL
jgi:hypothetical protein